MTQDSQVGSLSTYQEGNTGHRLLIRALEIHSLQLVIYRIAEAQGGVNRYCQRQRHLLRHLHLNCIHMLIVLPSSYLTRMNIKLITLNNPTFSLHHNFLPRFPIHIIFRIRIRFGSRVPSTSTQANNLEGILITNMERPLRGRIVTLEDGSINDP